MELLQTIFNGITALATIVAIIAAFWIGYRQIQINNFVEIFMTPEVVVQDNKTYSKILIRNVSSYPIYLNSYVLNGVKIDIGSTPIPNNSNNWYAVVIPQDAQVKGELSLAAYFEDYLGKKYQSDGFGKFENGGWNVHQNKRVEENSK
jgi:hypothetical protein